MSTIYFPGSWDILHPGHIVALQSAKAFGDKLIVGVESDELIKEIKGHAPFYDEQFRCLMLMALEDVPADHKIKELGLTV